MPEPAADITGPHLPGVAAEAQAGASPPRRARVMLPRADRREIAAIFAGGALGTLLRAALAEAFPHPATAWPWPTFAVNIVAAFLLGYFITRLQERLPLSSYRRPLLGTGLCGGLSTFSTMQVDPEDDQRGRLGSCHRVRRGQHRWRVRGNPPGHRAGAESAGAAMSVLVWAGVVVIGGAGSVLRFLADGLVSSVAGKDFPYGTLAINISGAVILGLLTGLALGGDQALLAGTAAVGSYTTFSTWMLETQRMAEERQHRKVIANIAVSLVLGVAAAALGRLIGAHL